MAGKISKELEEYVAKAHADGLDVQTVAKKLHEAKYDNDSIYVALIFGGYSSEEVNKVLMQPPFVEIEKADEEIIEEESEEEAGKKPKISQKFKEKYFKGYSWKEDVLNYTLKEELHRMQLNRIAARRARAAKSIEGYAKQPPKVKYDKAGFQIISLAAWSNDTYKVQNKEILGLIEKSNAEAENAERNPLVEFYTGMVKAGDKASPAKEYSRYATAAHFTSKFKGRKDFPACVGLQLKYKKLKEASEEWAFAPGDSSAYQKYSVPSVIQFYAENFGKAIPNIEKKINLYKASRTLVSDILKSKANGHPLFYPGKFDAPDRPIAGRTSSYTWEEEFWNLVKLFNENMHAAQISNDEHLVAEGDSPRNRLSRWLIYDLVCHYFKKQYAATGSYLEIDDYYSRCNTLLSKAFTGYIAESHFINAREELLSYINRYWHPMLKNLENEADLWIKTPEISDILILASRDKEQIKGSIYTLKGTADKLGSIVIELERLLPRLMQRITEKVPLDYDLLAKSALEGQAKKDLQPARVREAMYIEKQSIISDDDAAATTRTVIEDEAKKAEYFIRTIYEPLIYDIIAMAILAMLLRKYVGYIRGIIRESKRYISIIKPKLVKRVKGD